MRSLAVAFAVGVSLVPPPALACSCTVLPDEQRFAVADLVFVGVLDRTERVGVGPAGRGADFVFAVDSVQKGDVGEEVAVEAPLGSTACGIDAVPGVRYQVYAFRGIDGPTTTACAGTRPLASPPPPVPPAAEPGRWLVVLAIAAGVASVRAFLGSRARPG